MKSYIHDFEKDETTYLIGFKNTINPNTIEIKDLKRREFPSKIVGDSFNLKLNKKEILNFDCFYTNMNCWVPNFNIDEMQDEKNMFTLTKEHLVSKKIVSYLNFSLEKSQHNKMVGAANFINHTFGHIPLVLKLYLREELRKVSYDKDDYSQSTKNIILKEIIKLSDKFLYKNNYPWQPWSYTDKDKEEIKQSESIYHEMISVDKEFLLINSMSEALNWIQNYNPYWIEKFKTN